MPSPTGPATNQQRLEDLLRQADSRYDFAGLCDLVAGVAAAPEGHDPGAWRSLVAESRSPDLDHELDRLRSALAGPQTVNNAADDAPAGRVAALRAALVELECDGFVVPHADEHQGEYLAARSERLTWLTGFSGSAGMAIVLPERAAIFVDGRYTLQVRDQVDTDLFEPRHVTDEPAKDWLAEHLPSGARLGYDPWLHTEDQVTDLTKAAERAGGTLVACAQNPIDEIWHQQPASPVSLVAVHGLDYAGEESAAKRQRLAEDLQGQGVDAAIITLPDSIAWLLNLRGGDVAHTPLVLSFAILAKDGTVDWFVDRRKLTPTVEQHLGNGVVVRAPEDLGPHLDDLAAENLQIRCDPARSAAWIFQRLRAAGCEPMRGEDPCQRSKACKNATELDGARKAHIRDGAALVRFLAWFAEEAPRRADGLGELEASEQLLSFRQQNPEFRDMSFETISGAGANGAIVHYRATPETERRLRPGDLYLVDSGGQYPDGTTDVTRTLAVGEPSSEMRDRFTRVLKGHIALATVRFPRGTTGSQLDALARHALWQAGLDYDHGTGHGVGSYLGVHEGPQRISKVPSRVPLEPGMIVSNEPGYYKSGAYGIRIENLVTVIEGDAEAEKPMLAFETLTQAPLDLALVDKQLLTIDEVAWLDGYHEQVRERLTPLLDDSTAAWLQQATRPLAK